MHMHVDRVEAMKAGGMLGRCLLILAQQEAADMCVILWSHGICHTVLLFASWKELGFVLRDSDSYSGLLFISALLNSLATEH